MPTIDVIYNFCCKKCWVNNFIGKYLMCIVRLSIFGFFVGIFLNKFVMFVNDGKMPVLIKEGFVYFIKVSIHVPVNQYTILPFWGDWIDFGSIQASPGDVVMYIFICVGIGATIAASIFVIIEVFKEKSKEI